MRHATGALVVLGLVALGGTGIAPAASPGPTELSVAPVAPSDNAEGPRYKLVAGPHSLVTGSDPVVDPVVVIDPGHDARANPRREPIGPGASETKVKDGGGTSGVVTGTPEAVVNLAVSRRLRRLLERAGVDVIMTRTRTSGVSMGNIARAQIANRAGADLFLRIHADGSENRSRHGTHTLIPALRRGWTDDIYAASRRAGRLVQRALVRRLGSLDLGLNERSDITGFNWSDVPAILVEVGFLSYPAEDRLLNTPSYQQKAARGMCEGALRFLKLPVRCG